MPGQGIPKIIHYCWLSDDPVPETIKAYMESWKILKDYEFIKWDRKRFNLNEHLWAKGAFNAKKYAFAADEVRLYALYTHGGIYLDMDIEVIKKFDNLLKKKLMLATEFDDYGIEAGCMGAQKGNPFIKQCLDYFKDRPFVQGEVMPIIMRQIMEEKFPELISELKTKDYFTAKDYFTGLIKKTRNTYCVHNYAGSWKDKTDSDKQWVHDRWDFFARNGDSKQNVELFKELERYKNEAADFETRTARLQEEIDRLSSTQIDNTSSKRMLKVAAKRALKRVL